MLAYALALTGGFMVIEVAVGFYAGSLALIADAGHMLADTGALGLAWIAQRFAAKPRSVKSTYGLRRAEVLAAFVNGITLSVTAIWVVSEAIERWVDPPAIRAVPMVLTAVLGLCVNLLVAAILVRAQRDSLNVRAAFLHVASDALGSLVAIVAGLAVWLFDVRRADPALGIVIAVLVAYSGWRVLREATRVLLEAAPAHLDVAAIERSILDCAGVASAHDLHVWRISDRFDALTVHVVLERGAHGVDVCQAVSDRLRRQFGLGHVTVQPEAPPPEAFVQLRLSREGGPSAKT